jgi:hypothetical protein
LPADPSTNSAKSDPDIPGGLSKTLEQRQNLLGAGIRGEIQVWGLPKAA